MACDAGSKRGALVDAERARARLGRLEYLLERLDEVRAGGEADYLADERLQAATERWLQLAVQACIDIGASLVAERSTRPPADYAGVFMSLAAVGALPGGLAERLAAAARQRNLLVHAYLDLDPHEVFASLGRLDDLRQFAALADRLADE